MKHLKVKTEILHLLNQNGFKVFTCPALTDAYYKLPSCSSPNKRAAGQLVNRAIKLLEKQGAAKKDPCDTRKSPEYHLTTLFYKQAKEGSYKIDSTETTTQGDPFVANLTKKLNTYKIELLTSIGEVEEYEDISQAAPERTDKIQILYNRARDNYSKTLGRVKAIESLIAQNQ